MLKPGDVVNELTIINKIDNTHTLCKCSCGRVKQIKTYDLTTGRIQSCGHLNHSNGDLIGNTFGDIYVIESVGRGRYKCQCKCGNFKVMAGGDIRRNRGIRCTHNAQYNQDNMIGKKFGELTVIGHKGEVYTCKCSCGNILDIPGSHLKGGSRKSCGCLKYRGVKDSIGKTFGYLRVDKFIGNGKVECTCLNCNSINSYKLSNLRQNTTLSCGCMKSELQQRAKDKLYNRERTDEQLKALNSKESLIEFINKHFPDRKPMVLELCDKIGLTRGGLQLYIDKYELYDALEKGDFSSRQEVEIADYLAALVGTENIVRHDKSILNGKELDIVIPKLKIAIEFNGNFWHSDFFKDTNYHQDKTIQCVRVGYRLIHIFEYEWYNNKDKIKALLKSICCENKRKVYGRDMQIKYIDIKESGPFIDKYHLDGDAGAAIKLGAYSNDELIGVMTFGKPRFANNIEYELIKFVWKPDIIAIGGAEKLFRRFIKDYKPSSIVSYCNISKFNGNSYIRMGFNPKLCEVTKPNYVWVKEGTNEVLSRYQTQKHKLIKEGYGTLNDTEDDMMRSSGYIKIYNAGNLKLLWEED